MARNQHLVLLAIGCALALSLLLATAALARDGIVHVVCPGDTIGALAREYGVSAEAIVEANRLANRYRIYVGQRLCIPVATGRDGCPEAPTPRRSFVPPEEIVILSPTQGAMVTSPLTVTGLTVGLGQSLVAVVLDGSAREIGRAYGANAGERSWPGAFSVTVPFALPANSQGGRIQLWSVSAVDGAVEHLSSVRVILQGLELDPLLAKLDAALAAKDYAALRPLMADSFRLIEYGSQGVSLSADQALAQLLQRDLAARAPRLDFSVNARDLLGDRIDLGPDTLHVVYSTGWGRDGADSVFLLIAPVAGRARWSGLLYVPGGIAPR